MNTFGPFGHMLAVDAFASQMCSPYATPATAAANLKQYGAAYRQCYSWYGPNQPGVNEADPSNPGGCVPDPGGAPPGETGPQTTAKACPPGLLTASPPTQAAAKRPTNAGSTPTPGSSSKSPLPSTPTVPGVKTPAIPGVTTPTIPGVTTPTVPGVTTPTTPGLTPQSPNNQPSGTPTAQQAQQLLNYLLSP